MRLAKHQELRPLLQNIDKITPDLITEAWEIHGLKHHFAWFRFDQLEKLGIEYAVKQGWDPDTTLLLYIMPPDNPNGDPVPQEVWEQQLAGPTLLNHTNCVCSLYPNMTLQKLADMVNQIGRMKAFL